MGMHERDNARIKHAIHLMRCGYGREDIGVKMADPAWVDLLFAKLRKYGRLNAIYAGRV